MTYLEYVVAAYAVFATVLLWDFVVPRIRIARLRRAIRLLAGRQSARRAPPPELKR